MFISLLSLLLLFLFDSVLIGIAFFTLFKDRVTHSPIRSLVTLVIIFFLQDLFIQLSTHFLDVTVLIRNEALLNFFDMTEPVEIMGNIEYGIYDPILFLIQSLVAYFLCKRITGKGSFC